MHRYRYRAILEKTLLAITSLFVLGGLIALGFLTNLSQENRALIIMVSSIGIIGGYMGLVLISAFWKRLRKRTWQKAMAAWKQSSQNEVTLEFDMTTPPSEKELKQLAIHIYSRMGYRIPDREVKDYLPLLNPDGKVELLVCKHQANPIELHHVYSLELEMKRVKAVRGFIWASVGFTDETFAWVVHRPILLVDRREIARLKGRDSQDR